MRRWMTYTSVLAALLTLILVARSAHAGYPETCDPKDREVPGNTNTPCKYDFEFDTFTALVYTVEGVPGGNSCREKLSFEPAPDWSDYRGRWDSSTRKYDGNTNAMPSLGYNNRKRTDGTWVFDRALRYYVLGQEDVDRITTGLVRHPLTVNSAVASVSLWQALLTKKIYLRLGGTQRFPAPMEINDYNLLMNDCLAGIVQRLENEAKLEEVRQRVEAERVAKERAAQDAIAEAERQRLETEAAREALRLASETELAKTQALIQQLEREKIIIGIWQDIVVEKQKGAAARAEVTNRYLLEIEADAASFRESVVAKAAEIRRLEEINNSIADAIIAHNDEVELQLRIQAEAEAAQRARLDELTIQPDEDSKP